LADNHGLEPEDARPAAFEAERKMVDYTYTADKETADICTRCHSMGRVISERRTTEEWSLLLAMHRGYYPLVDGPGGFRRPPRGSGAGDEPPAVQPGAPEDTRQPMDK